MANWQSCLGRLPLGTFRGIRIPVHVHRRHEDRALRRPGVPFSRSAHQYKCEQYLKTIVVLIFRATSDKGRCGSLTLCGLCAHSAHPRGPHPAESECETETRDRSYDPAAHLPIAASLARYAKPRTPRGLRIITPRTSTTPDILTYSYTLRLTRSTKSLVSCVFLASGFWDLASGVQQPGVRRSSTCRATLIWTCDYQYK